MTLDIVGNTLEINGVHVAMFSSPMAAYEAAMRICDSDWMPSDGETYFNDLDFEVFELLRVHHAEHPQ